MLERIPLQLKLAALVGFVFTGPIVLVALFLFGVWGAIGAILLIALIYTVLYFVAVRRYL